MNKCTGSGLFTVKNFGKNLFRRKSINEDYCRLSGDLSRCLTTFDLTNLGIGSILGAGLYVVVGQVAADIAGPSVIISIAIAAFTSLLSGLCYAEFGSRVPRTTGSAYAYSYHTVGEIIAFIIGWNLILEYMIGTAADARALSSAIDYLLGHSISNFSLNHFGTVPLTNAVPDVMGFILTLTVTIILAAGVKESARYTIVFNILTITVAIFIIIAGGTKAKIENWNKSGPSQFFPQGMHGVLSGAATCFYAFVGYDIIATTGEEAKSPSRSIPLAIALTLLICLLMYMGVGTVLTLMVAFGHLKTDSPITEAFDKCGLSWARWPVGIGGVAGMSASLMGSEFPLPRIIYAMACDGLLFKCFSRVWSRTEVPICATVVPGIMTAFFTMMFKLDELVEMMSIGTLLAYSLVCTSVLLLRYRFNDEDDMDVTNNDDDEEIVFEKKDSSQENSLSNKQKGSNDFKTVMNYSNYSKIATVIFIIWILSFCIAAISLFAESYIMNGNVYAIISLVVLLTGIVFCTVWLCWQQQNHAVTNKLYFKVPLVPILPIIAIVFNIILMIRLSYITWIRFSIWLSLGFLVYFGYGIRHSKLRKIVYTQLLEEDNDKSVNCAESIPMETVCNIEN